MQHHAKLMKTKTKEQGTSTRSHTAYTHTYTQCINYLWDLQSVTQE